MSTSLLTKQSEETAIKTATPSGQSLDRPFFQTKLTVNTPGDHCKQEADDVADQVMRMVAFDLSSAGEKNDAPLIQRTPLIGIIGLQRACVHFEEEQQAQRKATGGDNASGQAAPSVVSDVLSPGGGQAMNGGTRQFMESRFGQDFSQARVYTDAQATENAQAIRARASTSGKDIVFGNGEYQHSSEGGEQLLAHELVHVGQQSHVAYAKRKWCRRYASRICL